jgi:hypothetical protein
LRPLAPRYLYFSYDARRQPVSHSYGIVCLSFAFAHGRALGTPATAEDTMTAVPLTSPNLFRCAPTTSAAAIEPEGERCGISPIGEPTLATAPFQPLDPSIVNDTIPTFFIGRNSEGFWVARDVRGKIGGIFLFENSARSFARRNSEPAGCATIFPLERFELDLENSGNPLVGHLRSLLHFATRRRQSMAALIGKMTEAVKRRSKHRPRSP